ncbi:HAMP domain-containing histidine kinase [Streptacidiphilus sp. ASG 303]|uniref:sensor histidine kinase n=1 Tax=Streptacidiphilus sp. ASG 303 TaxID=2896847 RepID=UPI001E5EA2DB|nr:HAMP domain-containing sensor histidine kinase [Streptacidiphilus sp. ASG 303]MCD0484835.1 HAMP domain-containing histidine kinase [Streptacidiphilus sp. ASG 303]
MSAVGARHSLLTRLLMVSALVSVCSIAATAWVVVQTTAVVLSRERGQALDEDARVYDTLTGYAATHPDWSGVRPVLEGLARQTGHRIVLTGRGGRPVADSAPDRAHPFRPPQRATAVIDPLAANTEPVEGTDSARGTDSAGGTDRIDRRALGPFRLPEQESRRLAVLAGRQAGCLRNIPGLQAEIRTGLDGRPHVVATGTDGREVDTPRCAVPGLDAPTPSGAKALASLNALVNGCLTRRGTGTVHLTAVGAWEARGRPLPSDAAVSSCLTSSRIQQLAPYVAPAALLYIGNPERTATTFFNLSPSNRLRIGGWAVSVLVVTVAVTALAGVRLVRPLRVLTGAATRMEHGDLSTRVEVRGRDEIALLGAAFNAMSQRREQLESLRRDMTSDIAHELRTPVSIIRGWLEAVEDGIADPDADLVASLLEQARHLQHVIDDLRDLSAAEAGGLRLALEPVEVAEMLSGVLSANRAAAQEAGLTLGAVPGGALLADADPVRLRQIVGNLVSNAIRYTPRGGAVTLAARADREAVVIDVADTGIGIAADELPHVFDRFWRADKSRSRRSGGSGLGLAIVRRLVEAHGGTVSVSSVPGEGSTFTVRLPRHPDDAGSRGPSGRARG